MVEEEWGNKQVPDMASAEVCFLIWSLEIGYYWPDFIPIQGAPHAE